MLFINFNKEKNFYNFTDHNFLITIKNKFFIKSNNNKKKFNYKNLNFSRLKDNIWFIIIEILEFLKYVFYLRYIKIKKN